MSGRNVLHFLSGAALCVSCGSDSAHRSTTDGGPLIESIPLPDGAPGIGFDDLRWAPGIRKILAPAGRSGKLDLIDPTTLEVTSVDGFSTSSAFVAGSHDSGCTSADEGNGVIYANDHEKQAVVVVDEATLSIVTTGALAGGPDYVRYGAAPGEIWVTEPGTGAEIVAVPTGSGAPVHAATIPVTGGPEAIVIDRTRARVYTNSFTGSTFAIDVAGRTIAETWSNGCTLSLGVALDEARGFLFVACAEGRVVVLDIANSGAKLGELAQGSGLDILSYDPLLHHLYVQGTASGDLAFVAVSAAGTPTLLGTVPTAQSGSSVTDGARHVFVADPAGGALIRVRDTYPKTD